MTRRLVHKVSKRVFLRPGVAPKVACGSARPKSVTYDWPGVTCPKCEAKKQRPTEDA